MGRPPLSVGTYGSITVAWSERESAFKARARYRDADGQVRPVARFGATKGAAERTLKTALRDRQRAGGLGITADMLIADLADEFLARVDASEKAIGTKQQYRKAVKTYVKPALGAVRVGEARVSICDTALRTINDRHGYSVAKLCRAVLSGMFGLAVRQDALPANPIRDVDKLTGSKRPAPRALEVGDDVALTAILRGLPSAGDLDLPDLIDFMLATGCRIGEALACREGHNEDGEPLIDFRAGTWEINATVVRITGRGLAVQERAKSEAGHRILALPPFAVDLLLRRRERSALHPRQVQILGTNGQLRTVAGLPMLFTSPSARTLRDPSNAEKDLRRVLDRIDCTACDNTGFQVAADGTFKRNAKGRPIRCAEGPWSWVTSHTFRKTVASRMEEAGMTPRQVADQLGHSKVSMTQDVYFGRKVVVADAARVLDRSA